MIGAMNRVKNGMLLARMKHMVLARYPWSVNVKLPTVCFWVKTKYPIRGKGIGRPEMRVALLTAVKNCTHNFNFITTDEHCGSYRDANKNLRGPYILININGEQL